MPNKKGLLTRKELNRFKKAELLAVARNAGISCKGKMLKRELVDCIFKRKDLRSSLQAPEKRKLTEKQKANLLRLQKRNYKDEKKIKGQAQDKVDGNIIQDTMVTQGKIKPRYKELVDRNKEIKQLETNFKKADKVSNDMGLYNRQQNKQNNIIKDNKKRLRKATMDAQSFIIPDDDDIGGVIGATQLKREALTISDELKQALIERKEEREAQRVGQELPDPPQRPPN